jgi:hypothetical protein
MQPGSASEREAEANEIVEKQKNVIVTTMRK